MHNKYIFANTVKFFKIKINKKKKNETSYKIKKYYIFFKIK